MQTYETAMAVGRERLAWSNDPEVTPAWRVCYRQWAIYWFKKAGAAFAAAR